MFTEKKKENTAPVLDTTAVGAIDDTSLFHLKIDPTGKDLIPITLKDIIKRPFTRLVNGLPDEYESHAVYQLKLFKGFSIEFSASCGTCSLYNFESFSHREARSRLVINDLRHLDTLIHFFNA